MPESKRGFQNDFKLYAQCFITQAYGPILNNLGKSAYFGHISECLIHKFRFSFYKKYTKLYIKIRCLDLTNVAPKDTNTMFWLRFPQNDDSWGIYKEIKTKFTIGLWYESRVLTVTYRHSLYTIKFELFWWSCSELMLKINKLQDSIVFAKSVYRNLQQESSHVPQLSDMK